MNHIDILKIETDNRKIVLFGYDNEGLCAVKWHYNDISVNCWQWIRPPYSPINWKTRCHIDLIICVENNINHYDKLETK